MVTCKLDTVPAKMSGSRQRRPSSTSSGFRLLDGDQMDSKSSVSRNSIYKIKIDAMFDDSRSVISQRLDDRRGSHRTGSIIMYGRRSDITSNSANSNRMLLANSSTIDEKDLSAEDVSAVISAVQKDVQRISNSVQAQIERMFTDVAKDATSCSFPVRCLGSLPLKDKVTSLQGLQDPLRQLYLSGAGQGNHNTGNLDICPKGLRVIPASDRDTTVTPFHNIAVWSAVKFVVSPTEGGAAFLPLITDPENIDKSTLFRPLTAADQRRLSSGLHAPIFAVVMRSPATPKLLECHGFVCQTPEDAIVIAATLYQSLMAHVGASPYSSTKRRTPRNQNGVSCISIASSSALTNSTPALRSLSKKNSFRSSNKLPPIPARPPRKKRNATSSLSGDSDTVREVIETSTEERKKKSHKTKRAPPIPAVSSGTRSSANGELFTTSMSYLEKQSRTKNSHLSGDALYQVNDGSSGDILTRVAIPRSGSFLNTSGLTRYKSRATRRHSGKNGGGGGSESALDLLAAENSIPVEQILAALPLPIPFPIPYAYNQSKFKSSLRFSRSPLGFSELFNEFRLHENLHSLDDILNAIIDADGMSFNDLKPIYKEFLLKLAVTLTKDELYQRSKNIMRRQKKKKLKRKNSTAQFQKSNKGFILGARSLKKVFWFGQFRSCKSSKSSSRPSKQKPTINQSSTGGQAKNAQNARTATSGSDMSETRNEHTLNAINRNSSSGYVSCSECSYDSEACTCTSADRCYCSLGADHDRVNEKLAKTGARDSLVSCKTEDKCYCSMGETNGESSETTWCDSDSCLSTSKCYCKRNHKSNRATDRNGSNQRKDRRSKDDKLALDYELFTVGGGAGSSRPVKAHEALSVKKSVEVAAVFADVKLSQTTDIKSLTAGTFESNRNSSAKHRSISSKKGSHRSSSNHSSSNRSSSHRSSSTSDILSKLDSIEKETNRKGSIKIPTTESNYQSMRPVSVSLEDTLGYLP